MTESRIYNTDIIVQYTSNLEYRRCIRDVFRMNVQSRTKELRHQYGDKWDTFEEETQDELLFDDRAATRVIEFLYDLTCDIQEFKDLYLKAAEVMISEDMNLGLTILLSYDNFSGFHQCLVSFLTSDSDGPVINDTTRFWIEQFMEKFDRNKKMI